MNYKRDLPLPDYTRILLELDLTKKSNTFPFWLQIQEVHVYKKNKVTFCGTRIENELFLASCFTRDLAGVEDKMKRFRHTDTNERQSNKKNDRDIFRLYTHTEIRQLQIPMVTTAKQRQSYFVE